MNDIDHDDLRSILRRADPAASLPPLSTDRFERLLKDTTMADTTTPTTPTTSRTRIAFAAVGGLAAAGIAAFAIVTAIPAQAPTVLEAAPGGIALKCANVTVDSFADVDLAFEAQVTSIAGDTVTLHVTDRFAGEVADTVVTTQGDGEISDGGPLVYEPGATYLIASVDGRVLSCGQSGVENSELRSIYDAAF
jgi:hypothetical protein